MEAGGQGDTEFHSSSTVPVPMGSGKRRLWGWEGGAGAVYKASQGQLGHHPAWGTYPCSSVSQGLESKGHQFRKNTNNSTNKYTISGFGDSGRDTIKCL